MPASAGSNRVYTITRKSQGKNKNKVKVFLDRGTRAGIIAIMADHSEQIDRIKAIMAVISATASLAIWVAVVVCVVSLVLSS